MRRRSLAPVDAERTHRTELELQKGTGQMKTSVLFGVVVPEAAEVVAKGVAAAGAALLFLCNHHRDLGERSGGRKLTRED
jgi:hypothetical protein